MPFTLPPNSPIFIFPFQNGIATNQGEEILNRCNKFLNQWKSHGSDLSAKVWIEENQFLIFVIDSSLSEPTGCSKDKLYHFIESLKDLPDTQLGDINKFWIKKEDKFLHLTKKELKDNLENGALNFDNQLFPLWILDLEQYSNCWAMPLRSFKVLLKL